MERIPRKLRVLLIDDVSYKQTGSVAQSTLGSDDLDVVPFPSFRNDAPEPYLKRWEDHLEFWRDLDEYGFHPEVLIIDCHFDRDDRVPAIAQRRPDDQETDEPLDPRGLLHGVVQAARLLGMHPWYPFGFVVYSQNLPRYAADGYAVTLFGILQAMGGNLQPFNPQQNVIEIVQQQMLSHHRGGHPSNAWQLALQRYRFSLANAFDELRVVPQIESFVEAIQWCRQFVETGTPPPAGASVRWRSGWGGDEEILLSSLFADCRKHGQWVSGALNAGHIRWLQGVIDVDWKQRVYGPAAAWMDDYRSFPTDSRSELPKPQFERRLTDHGRALILTLLWVHSWLDTKQRKLSVEDAQSERKPTSLQDALSIAAAQSTRAVRALMGGQDNLMGYVGVLENSASWPKSFPMWLNEAVRQYLTHHLKLPQKDWPPIFRDDN